MTLLVTEAAEDMFLGLLERVSSVKKLYGVVAYLRRWLHWAKRRSTGEPALGALTSEELSISKKTCVKLAQCSVDLVLQASSSQGPGVKVHGKFRRLAPYEDNEGI